MSRMDILSPNELKNVISNSKIRRKYNEQVYRESAYELLSDKIKRINKINDEEQEKIKNLKKKYNLILEQGLG